MVAAEDFRSAVSMMVSSIDDEGRSLMERLDDLVAGVKAVLDVPSVGLMVITDDGELRILGTSDEHARTLESAQLATREGPGWEAAMAGTVVATRDVHADERWPALRTLVADSPMRGLLNVPIVAHGEVVGSLNVISLGVRDWTDEARDTLVMCASLVGLLLVVAARGRGPGGSSISGQREEQG